jgi:hypothetical protein
MTVTWPFLIRAVLAIQRNVQQYGGAPQEYSF